jgi:hypothetical protein
MKHHDDANLFEFGISGMGSFPEAGTVNGGGQKRTR